MKATDDTTPTPQMLDSRRRLFEARDLALGGLMGALALVLPIAFHAVPNAGPAFLPMYYPIMALALLASWEVAVIVAVLVPVLSSLLTGMPPPPMAVLMIGELAAMAAVASLLRPRLGLWPAAVLGLLAARVAGVLLVVSLIPLIGEGRTAIAYATTAFVVGLPGTVVLLTVVPAAVYAIERAFMLGPRSSGRPMR